jgi:voltage-gated potassium channel
MEQYNRKLFIAATLVVAYLFVGTFFFHFAEGWRFIDSFYFSGVTLTTVGYGDFTPKHDLSKIVTVFFAFSGISIIFYSVSIMARHYFEQEERRLHRIWENARFQKNSFPGVVAKGADAVQKGMNSMAKQLNELAGGKRKPDLFVPIEHLQKLHFRKGKR